MLPIEQQTLILNGTGVNYSWHLPFLWQTPFEELKSFKEVYLISGGSTAYLVYWAHQQGLVTWTKSDFLNWNKHSKKNYGNGILSGLRRLYGLKFGPKDTAMYSEQMYYNAYASAAHPEFFNIKLGDAPENLRIPLYNFDKNEIVEFKKGMGFDDEPIYRISFASTAVPKVFSRIKIGDDSYGDPMYARGFIKNLKSIEQKSEFFVNYNLLKNKVYPNGKYIKICDHPNPKKMIESDGLKFMFGLHINSFPENIKKSNMT